ncbi:MAG TPA: hypothetical protein VNX21_01985 [Candidatus Thermoplasmatota archaeon]|nr:hypothetical protein [Candidatus Thermoplasmatota archaeon]
MATWAASGERVRVQARGGPVVLRAGGVRFLARAVPGGGFLLVTPGGRLAGRCDTLAECVARARDLAARRGD